MPLHELERAGQALGVRFTAEQTGGGCTAYTALLDGGAVLAITDDGLTPDLDGPLTISLFRSPEEWADSGCDPVATIPITDAAGLATGLIALLDHLR
jgi:hypothetical protein